jgi:magnesium-protoporphyrin IX monomethyl ester (oxidative) cyclase
MFRIALVNMPFSVVGIPSIALTQLQSEVRRRFGPRVAVEICYPSHDLCRLVGLDLYRWICDQAASSGLGDWLFRRLAFPELADNTELYRQRYFPLHERRAKFDRACQADLAGFLDRVIERYALRDCGLAGFTSMFTQTVGAFALARRLKEVKPSIVTAIGGANCEAPMGAEIPHRVPAIDYVFSGPALLSFPDLVGALLDGDEARTHRIGGVLSRTNTQASPPAAQPPAPAAHGSNHPDESNGPAPAVPPALPPGAPVSPLGAELPIHQLVELDYGPFLDDVERSFPGQTVSPVLLFETSRGCWWGERAHCTFCGLNGSTMQFRSMPADLASSYLRSLFAYAPRALQFSGVDNIMPKEYPRALFAHLTAPEGTSMFYEVKVDLSDEEVGILARAGVHMVQPGIEALATSTLILMRKGSTAARNVRFLASCLKHDVHPAWNLLIGFPGETEEVFRRYLADIPRLVHLPPPSDVHVVRFDRFSPYFTKAAEYGLDLVPLDYYSLIYPFGDEFSRSFAYYFADRNSGAPYYLAAARWVGKLRRAVAAWRQGWSTGGGQPQLHFDALDRVIDSRAGAPVVHEVGQEGRRILETLNKPATAAELAALPELAAAADLPGRLAQLQALGLLFEDRQRLVSLVMPHAVDPQRILAGYGMLPAEAA